ncbi:MAG: dTDP-4-dehydrorhamnose 3,5-epimerase [Chitinispirillales bacterium]|jgi:dTDP-4-dehydrorhamnose 3,5-epimerase|nr:dTDP-4-dehydrorhamnose 3,5-epimerase [Chitinispirillales bacterium]
MPFSIEKAPIDGLIIIEPKKFYDFRGFFEETYKKSDFTTFGIKENFVQDNHSCSKKGVVRGIHFQRAPFAQGKLIRVLKGKVWDVAVDLRKKSPTFAKWFGVELSEENSKMFYIPPGFGHGFSVLEDDTHLFYKCTNEYNCECDGGIRWNDPDISVDWKLDATAIISEKDDKLPLLKEVSL